MTRGSLFRSPPSALLVVTLAAALGPGCGLVLDFDPPQGNEIECVVTVVNPDGIEVDLSSLTSPEFVEAVPSFGGGGGVPVGGGSGATRPIRPYYTCPSGCPAGCPMPDTAAAEASFRRYLNQRIAEVASGPESDSPFFVHAGPWCVKEEDGGATTLRCRETARLTDIPACDVAPSAPPLPGCPGAVPMGTCVEVECRGRACGGISFPLTPLGGSSGETVTVRNCGGPDDDSIAIMLEEVGAIVPIGAFADFRIEDDPAQPCGPRTPAEEVDGRVLTLSSVDLLESECRFDVIFEPQTGGDHVAELVFNTTPVSPVRIDLRGVGEPGTLVDTLPASACLNNPDAAGCSEVRVFNVTNPGPGTVTITDAFFDAASAGNFSILAPTVFPITVPPGGSVEFRVQWCMGGSDPFEGGLTILSNADPPYEEQRFEFRRAACPPGS